MDQSKDLIDRMLNDEEIKEEVYEEDDYDPDQFYEEAINFLSIYGYERFHEHIWEAEKHEHEDIEDFHFEAIAELEAEDIETNDYQRDPVYLRFILKDGRPGRDEPKISKVEGSYDFELLS